MEIRRKANVATTIVFPLIDQANRPFYKSGATTTDKATEYYWDGAAYAGYTLPNDPVEIGSSGVYSLALGADDMEVTPGYPMVIVVKDTGTAFDTQTIIINIDSGSVFPRATAIAGFTFMMTLNRVPVAGATVTSTISKDGGSFVACNNSASHIANGLYKINIDAAETNANIISLRFTADGCDDLAVTIPIGG